MKSKQIYSAVTALALAVSMVTMPLTDLKVTVPDTAVTASAAAIANVYTTEDFTYSVKDNKVTLLKYTGQNEKVVFPNTIEGKRVVAVAKTIFDNGYYTNVRKITISSNIETIEEGAFRLCTELEEVKCDSSKFSFTNGMLFSNLPHTKAFYCGPVGTMSKYDLYGNTVEPDEGYTDYVTDNINVTRELIWCDPTKSTVNVPNGVDAIGAYAFADAYEKGYLTLVNLPSTIKYIGDHAFYNCAALKTISQSGTTDSASGISIPSDARFIGALAFAGCNNMQTLNLNENLEAIGEGAFLSCNNLKTAYIPEKTKWLGAYSFGYMANGDLPSFMFFYDYYGYDHCLSLVYDYCSGISRTKNPFLLMSKVKMSENGELSPAAQFAQNEGINFVDDETYQNSDLDENGNHTGTHQGTSSDGEVVSYDVSTKTHNPNDDLDHDYALSAFVAPTCTTPGGAAGICYCGHSFFYQFPALGHAYTYTVIPPTCTEEGYTVYKCSRCGDEQITDLTPKKDITPATGHTFVDFVTEATYDYDGYTEHVCEDCGYSYTDNIVPQLQRPDDSSAADSSSAADISSQTDSQPDSSSAADISSQTDSQPDSSSAADISSQTDSQPDSSSTVDSSSQTDTQPDSSSQADSSSQPDSSSKPDDSSTPDTPVPTPTPAKTPISKATVTVANKVYTGKALKPAPTVKLSGKTLNKGTDYTVSYKNNTKCGKATVTVSGKGSYTGTKSGSFIIKPARMAAKKLTSPKTKQIKLTWTKAAGGVTGYQVQYALNKTFTKSKKSVTVAKATAASKTITKLTKGKTYYARVRSYKTVGKTKYYGAWSTAKKVKCK